MKTSEVVALCSLPLAALQANNQQKFDALFAPHLMPTRSVLHEGGRIIGVPDGKMLVSSVLQSVDGRMVTLNVIEGMRGFQSKILHILNGKHAHDGSYVGAYKVDGKSMSLYDLCDVEATQKDTSTFIKKVPAIFTQAKDDFMSISSEFKESSPSGPKQIWATLIKQSCEQRGRNKSLLITWADAEEKDEDLVLERNVKNFTDLKTFCEEMLCFLSDVIVSCPQANNAYEKKQRSFRELQTITIQLSKNLRNRKLSGHLIEFFLWVNNRGFLDSLAPTDVTVDCVQNLISEFTKSL